jgi:hypothetical protein
MDDVGLLIGPILVACILLFACMGIKKLYDAKKRARGWGHGLIKP